MSACTITARNYLARAQVLTSSFQAHHPGLGFYTLVTDGDESDRALSGLGTVVLPSDLSLPAQEWAEMAGIYGLTELATSAKPAMLEHVLDRHRTATYFDPDIKIYAPVLPLLEGLGPVQLTPHCLTPLPRDELVPSEQQLMGAGLFNLGFIGVTQAARPFLRWWHERLRRDALAEPEQHLFTDQRWVDWVPSLFDHTVLRDPGFNVGYWNAHERSLSRADDGTILASGAPLRFFHFSGFDPTRPDRLSRHATDRARVHLGGSPALPTLCSDYAAALEAHGDAEHRQAAYRLDRASDGTQLTPSLRGMIRAALIKGTDVPDPFGDAGPFRRWLSEPVHGSPASPLTRWDLLTWHERPDLQVSYPDVEGADAAGFRDWLHHDFEGRRDAEHPFGPPPAMSRPWSGRPGSRVGWSVIAYADAELGLGETGRRMARAVQQVGTPTEVVGVSETLSRQQHRHGLEVRRSPSFDNTITCVNGNHLQRAWDLTGVPHDRGDGRRIALWFWEVDRLPEEWVRPLSGLDQLWVTNPETRELFEQLGLCRVEEIRLPVVPRQGPTPHTRGSLGWPEDRFVFLCCYDFFSVLRRKNPLDVLTAYTSCFGPDDGATLVLKSINGHLAREDLGRVVSAARGRPDVLVIDGYRSSGEMAGMVELADCMVSLHRSEGYGLNLIDAMTVGTPVVATGYSGNMTFMDDRSAFLVPYVEELVGPGSDPYPADAHWAQPDLTVAAELMRSIFDDPSAARERGLAGQQKVLRENSLETVGTHLRMLTRDVLMGAAA